MSMLELWNYEEMLQNSTPLQLGETMLLSKDQVADMIKETFATNEANSFSTNIPTCTCGMMSGSFYLGCVCPECGTTIEDVYVDKLKYKTHIHIPEPMPAVLHPTVYLMLCRIFKKSNIDKLLDPDAILPNRLDGFPQGNLFREKFIETIDRLITMKSSNRDQISHDIHTFLGRYNDCIWVRDLPIMDSSLHSVSDTGDFCEYGDNVSDILATIWLVSEMQYCISSGKVYNKTYVEHNTAIAYEYYMTYVETVLKDQLFGKDGMYRKHVLGTRCHFSFRAVISPRCGVHNSECITMPWRVAIAVYELELHNKLRKRGYNLMHSWQIIKQAEVSYDPLIDELFKELISESPFPEGLSVVFGRNPSLRPGAIYLLYVDEITTDVGNKTIGISSSIASAPNFDFDGDAGLHGIYKFIELTGISLEHILLTINGNILWGQE